MKKLNKGLLALSVPFAALILTSCNGAAPENIGFYKAMDYASKHYDEYALDAVPAAYEIKINKFYVDLSFEADIAGHLSEDFRAGFEGINVIHNNIYAAHIGSAVLDSLQTYFGELTNFFIEFGADDLVDLNYYLDNQDLLMKVEASNGGTLINFIPRIIGAATTALRVANLFHGYVDPTNEDVNRQPDPEDPQKTLPPEDQVGYLMVQVAGFIAAGIGMLSNFIEFLPISPVFAFDFINYYGISIDQSLSGSKGEKTDLSIRTDKYGFLKESHLAIASSDFMLTGGAFNNEYSSDTPQNKDKVVDSHGPYRFNLSGSFDIDVEVNTIFKD